MPTQFIIISLFIFVNLFPINSTYYHTITHNQTIYYNRHRFWVSQPKVLSKTFLQCAPKTKNVSVSAVTVVMGGCMQLKCTKQKRQTIKC